MKKFKKFFKKKRDFKKLIPSQFTNIITINLIIIATQISYILLRFNVINEQIPFWYTKNWGTDQLATKQAIYLIPITSLLILILGAFATLYTKRKNIRLGELILLTLITTANTFLLYSLYTIVSIASLPFEPLIATEFTNLIPPFFTAIILSFLLAPRFIKLAKKYNLVTDPGIHKHPGMLLKRPSARGGGIIFAIVFIITCVIFVPINKELIGLIAAITITSLVGLIDDIENTNPRFKFKSLTKPLARLLFWLPLAAAFIIFFSGITIDSINNPLNGALLFNQFTIDIFGTTFAPLAIGVTFLWVLWLINMLSWSNGVDGQYAGIISITGIVIAILALRLVDLEPVQENVAVMAIILAGASIGLIPYTWHPSKMMWGFSATAAGIVIATLSIITRTKIAASVVVLLIPFLDGVITVLRRLLQGNSPFKADRYHLHHLLLQRGWGVKSIVIFYWITTAIFGLIAILAAERALPLLILTIGGIIAFIIASMNFIAIKKNKN